ncbi:MAG: DUF1330 domain-containing protein [Rhodovulum sp.]|jgi:uncharacterized protein (DUF1330 family)|uniref:DUF1330 domain-containing protein n=1 Tax=Rhodovulum sp. FJ3 TaxID=3079053 RepID=UPI000C091A54|nr:DUF1330 domain-containing protein [Rhodovulum sp. FJ3]MAY32369.1 hypothetical protein [Rhodovulum sp.]MCI5087013.1 DUF1330 domain-containing protein [Rhodovulum sp.]MDV4166472.1 DUF1330 domain-containing protein [Rhodovulum sp. FJ3]|tara:strand:- start:440 stop:727 length:288 start_codon:yes stop_codon:yes gene_type:complete
MPALWIAHVTVTDADAYGKYAELAGPAIAKHGGEFIARGGRFVQLEGKERPRNVVARFPSVEAAETCYHSDEYQAALDHARGASERELVIVEITE